jgi:hypothetical protein
MWIEEQEHSDEAALNRPWQALQQTPSYVERWRDGRDLTSGEEHAPAQVLCPVCGFWVDGQHQCPTREVA